MSPVGREGKQLPDYPSPLRGLRGKKHDPGTPSVLFFWATLHLKPATIALKIGHLAFQDVFFVYSPFLVDTDPRKAAAKHLGEYTEDDPVLEICGRNSQSSAFSYLLSNLSKDFLDKIEEVIPVDGKKSCST